MIVVTVFISLVCFSSKSCIKTGGWYQEDIKNSLVDDNAMAKTENDKKTKKWVIFVLIRNFIMFLRYDWLHHVYHIIMGFKFIKKHWNALIFVDFVVMLTCIKYFMRCMILNIVLVALIFSILAWCWLISNIRYIFNPVSTLLYKLYISYFGKCNITIRPCYYNDLIYLQINISVKHILCIMFQLL